MDSNTTYLIDSAGNVRHTWPGSSVPNFSVYALENGSIIRTTDYIDKGITGVEIIDWDGAVVWKFEFYSTQHMLHHDIKPLPNGNILMISYEFKTLQEAIEAGLNPISGGVLPDQIIEVRPTGPTTGDIVWEWHVWNHLIQDFDPSKENYGVVADHPELIDINYGVGGWDWNHINSIDYNEEFDQILLSVHTFNEVWVIDHSTTTEEASGHTGGHSGKGGDLLYRWGNPSAYRAGTPSDQKFFGQHGASWIDPGCPGAGDILVFNNGLWRPEGLYSSVDEIVPPVNDTGHYFLEPGASYGPDEQVWVYTAENLTDFYSLWFSGAQRLPSGNTLICDGQSGHFFEVTPYNQIVWNYTNPYPYQNDAVFKISYYTTGFPFESDLDCDGSLKWTKISPGSTETGTFIVKNIGESNSSLDWMIESNPTWGTWTFTPSNGNGLTPEMGEITVDVKVVAPDEKNKNFTGEIKIVNSKDNTDFNIIPVSLSTPYNKPFIFTGTLLKHLLDAFPLLRKLFHNSMIISSACSSGGGESELRNTLSYYVPSNDSFKGYTLFSPEYSRYSYLMNNKKIIVQSWKSNYTDCLGNYLLENGNLVRMVLPGVNPTFVGGGISGRVETLDNKSNVVWEFEYFTNDHCLHHDIEPLPNGNILMIAWEYKTTAEAIASGRDPNKLSNAMWPDHIIEVRPTGPSTGEIVWEWHVWDHLIQDYDPSKANYGVVGDHPELVDINYLISSQSDWLHTNSIDYNEEFDQILLSIHNHNEIWVIDHSTTTEEAASHNGGNGGRGGDLLYRWGNPATYRAGTPSDQKFFGQHDASWIDPECPGAGDILVYNNGFGRPEGRYSSVDEVVPPVNDTGCYFLEPGSSYGPDEQVWVYTAENPTSVYSVLLSSAQRLPNGNTLLCSGSQGLFLEVTPEKKVVWRYTNLFPFPGANAVFMIQRYPTDYPGIHETINKNIRGFNVINLLYKEAFSFLLKNHMSVLYALLRIPISHYQ
jgi:hypothetical protein